MINNFPVFLLLFSYAWPPIGDESAGLEKYPPGQSVILCCAVSSAVLFPALLVTVDVHPQVPLLIPCANQYHVNSDG